MSLRDWLVFWPIVVACVYLFISPVTRRGKRRLYRADYRRGRADAIAWARRQAIAGHDFGSIVAGMLDCDRSVMLPYSRGWCAGVRVLQKELHARIGNDDLLLKFYANQFGAAAPAVWHLPMRRGV